MSWPLVPASELMLKRGGTLNPTKFPDEVFELLSIPAFDRGSVDVVAGAEIGSSKSLVCPNDVLLSKIIPHVRRCWVVPEKRQRRQIGSGEWIIFRDQRFHPQFLKHWLTSDSFHRQFMNTVAGVGGSLVRARPSFVEKIQIPLPPLEEQKRIAAILDKADEIRKKRQQAIELADQFLRSVFLDMFGDPVTNPKGWEVKSLDQMASVRSGVTKGRKLSGKPTVLVPYMRVANVQDGYLLLDDIQHIELLEGEVERYKLKAGDLLLTEGGDIDKLGRGAVWNEEIKDCVHQNHIFSVRTDSEIIYPEFLSAQIASQRGKRYFLKVGKQTTGIATINKTVLCAYPTLVPPLALQEAYLVTAKKTSDLLRKNERSEEALISNNESLRKRLIGA